MMQRVKAGPFTISGVSVGGIYTSLYVHELKAQFDVGMALRSHCGADSIFLSHGHADHSAGLGAMLAIRGLLGRQPPRVFLPKGLEQPVRDGLEALQRAHRFELAIRAETVKPGDEFAMGKGLHCRVFRTFHPGETVGYQLFRKVQKLAPAFAGLPGSEIARRKREGEQLFVAEEQLELAYATDTLVRVVDHHPSLLQTRVLILECTFLDERKPLEASRAGGHIHLDELLERAEEFENEALVLMHFSQLYSPAQVHKIIRKRCPPRLLERVVVFAPEQGAWPG